VEDRTVSNAKRYNKICSTNKALVALHLLQEEDGTPVEDCTVSNAKRYNKICSTNKALVALHLLQEVDGTPVEDRTVSNAKRADLATVPGYIPTQYPTQLDAL
jgi:hypothetical protein